MSVESRIETWKTRWQAFSRGLVPPARQFLRLLALPYCYLGQTNWRQCRRHPIGVMLDHAWLFFGLECYPDHYSPCRLWEQPRSRWPFYFGSSYNPYARGRLQKRIQPPEYRILFHDKLVCTQLCASANLPTPRHLGVFDNVRSLRAILTRAESLGIVHLIAKPCTGAGGKGIFVVDLVDGSWIQRNRVRSTALADADFAGRHVIEERLQQHPQLMVFHATALSTMRVVTYLQAAGDVRILGVYVRFGIGDTFVDNVSQGGISAGIDPRSGRLLGEAVDKNGSRFMKHPTSNFPFAGFVMPAWGEVVQLAHRVQQQFPYYRLLGLDLALTEAGPVVVEINPAPDIVGLEAASGPILADPELLAEFAAEKLLYSRAQRRLAANLERALHDQRL